MSESVLSFIEALLIPAGLLPIVTAIVLWRYRKANSQALRDRWLVAVVLALLGAMAALIASDALFDWGLGLERWIGFGIVLLAVDFVSGKWLIDYMRGRFR